MKTRNLLAALLLAATALAAAPASAQNLLVNGDFETGDFSGWTLSPGTFSMVGNDPLFAQSGNHNAFLEATGFIGTLSQTISTTPGGMYSISFWVGNDSGVTPNSFSAFWGGNQLMSLSNQPVMGYTQYTFNVAATGASTTLEFRFRHDDDFWRLDNVVVVPEPSTFGLLGVAAVGALVVRARRRHAAALRS